MKKFLSLLLIVSFCFQAKAQQTVPLDSVLKLTTEVIKEIGSSGQLPGATKVSINFETEVQTETSAGLKILIFSFGRKWAKSKTSSVTYNFSLHPADQMAESKKIDLKRELTIAIKGAYDQAKKIKNPLASLKGFTVSVSFTINKSTDGSAEYELVPITPSLGRSWSRRATHTIEVEFESK